MSADTKVPFIQTSVAVAAITLLIAFNIESILALIIWVYDKARDGIMKAMQEDSTSKKWQGRGNDLRFLHPRSKTRSEWWLCCYPLVLAWRWLRKWQTTTAAAKNSNASSSDATPPKAQVEAV